MGMNSNRRKLAIATWSSPGEGNIYGKMTVDAKAALAYLKAKSDETGTKVTLTHFVGKAVALALRESPGLNGYLKWGQYHDHKTVNVTYLVALEEGADLSKTTIERADEKDLVEIATELRGAAGKLRSGGDSDWEKSKGMIRLLPTWLLRPLLRLTGFLASSLGLRIKALGVQPFPFGSCVITSVGMFGLDEGYAPPTPFARVPLLVLIGALRDRPAVVDGEICIRPELTITATIDHRFMDGAQGGTLARIMRQVFADPKLADDASGLQATSATSKR